MSEALTPAAHPDERESRFGSAVIDLPAVLPPRGLTIVESGDVSQRLVRLR